LSPTLRALVTTDDLYVRITLAANIACVCYTFHLASLLCLYSSLWDWPNVPGPFWILYSFYANGFLLAGMKPSFFEALISNWLCTFRHVQAPIFNFHFLRNWLLEQLQFLQHSESSFPRFQLPVTKIVRLRTSVPPKCEPDFSLLPVICFSCNTPHRV
jgi:hypothetical protein